MSQPPTTPPKEPSSSAELPANEGERTFDELPQWLQEEARRREDGNLQFQVDREVQHRKTCLYAALGAFSACLFIYASLVAAILGAMAIIGCGRIRCTELLTTILFSFVVIFGLGLHSLGSGAATLISLTTLPLVPVMGFILAKVIAIDPSLD